MILPLILPSNATKREPFLAGQILIDPFFGGMPFPFDRDAFLTNKYTKFANKRKSYADIAQFDEGPTGLMQP